MHLYTVLVKHEVWADDAVAAHRAVQGTGTVLALEFQGSPQPHLCPGTGQFTLRFLRSVLAALPGATLGSCRYKLNRTRPSVLAGKCAVADGCWLCLAAEVARQLGDLIKQYGRDYRADLICDCYSAHAPIHCAIPEAGCRHRPPRPAQ